MALDYEKMLDEAHSQLPPDAFKHERFEVPKPKSAIIGRRRGPTILYNFKEICETLNQDPLRVLKFLSKEMATAGTMTGSRVIFKGKFDSIPPGAVGLYTYMKRLEQGVRQIMCGSRKFGLEHISRNDIAALTRQASERSGIQYIMDCDKGDADRIIG